MNHRFLIALLTLLVVYTGQRQNMLRSENCFMLDKVEAAEKALELAIARHRHILKTYTHKECVVFFDFDDTLVDTRSVVGVYRNIDLFAGIPYMVDLLHKLKPYAQVVILTARRAGSEAVVLKNAEKVGLRLRQSDVVATCPATAKAEWRQSFCAQHGKHALLVCGDRDTDVNGPREAISLRVYPFLRTDVVCTTAMPPNKTNTQS